jgi:hypothetical protein
MKFRSKSSERVASDIALLASTYDISKINFVDNIIDLKWLPELARALQETPVSLFVETKANLSPSMVQALIDARIDRIQPGIESLSDLTLGRMRKGISAIANIQLLKWSLLKGISLSWNILFGFPGETNDDYEEMVQWTSLLHHFQPPEVATRVRIDRFSPLFNELADGEPYPAYREVFSLQRKEDYNNIAYYFRSTQEANNAKQQDTVVDEVLAWRRNSVAALATAKYDGVTYIIDTRSEKRSYFTELSDLEIKMLYGANTRIVLSTFLDSFSPEFRAEEVAACWQKLVSLGWVIERNNAALSLVCLEEDFSGNLWSARVGARIGKRQIRRLEFEWA